VCTFHARATCDGFGLLPRRSPGEIGRSLLSVCFDVVQIKGKIMLLMRVPDNTYIARSPFLADRSRLGFAASTTMDLAVELPSAAEYISPAVRLHHCCMGYSNLI